MPAFETPTISTVEEFLQWTRGLSGRAILYRGLADSVWRVAASGHRRLLKSQRNKTGETQTIPDAVFANYVRRLLDRASMLGLRHRGNRMLSELELLAQLQHNGAATCLIDFTENPLVALWFACADEPNDDGEVVDGKVVAMPTGDTERFVEINYEDVTGNQKIEAFLGPDKLWSKWQPEHLGNRIVAQHACFVFGRGEIPHDYYASAKVDGRCKAGIREELAAINISEERLFGDLAGFCEVNAHGRADIDYGAEDYMHWGIHFQQTGEFSQAIANFDEAILRTPKNAVAYLNRGHAKGKSGDMHGALADFNSAIANNPQFGAAFNDRGTVKYELGEMRGALADYEQAIAIEPQYAEAYYNRGNIKQMLGDLEGARADYDQAIAINPQYVEAYYNRAILKLASGDETGAAEDFAAAAQLETIE